ncbi:MAG: glycoside hydrolase family 20 zincin-like fold domain-containing protein, partial [Saprospiraceae bacterium]|nr:glycoside hydrolase family 20 zincin-like fold domain-containing protein [Saprospiraceae bacterium]
MFFFLIYLIPGNTQEIISIIPKPVKLERKAGSFILDESTGYRQAADSGINQAVRLLTSECTRRSGINLKNTT